MKNLDIVYIGTYFNGNSTRNTTVLVKAPVTRAKAVQAARKLMSWDGSTKASPVEGRRNTVEMIDGVPGYLTRVVVSW